MSRPAGNNRINATMKTPGGGSIESAECHGVDGAAVLHRVQELVTGLSPTPAKAESGVQFTLSVDGVSVCSASIHPSHRQAISDLCRILGFTVPDGMWAPPRA